MLPERAASPVARARARVGRSRLRRLWFGLSNLSLARRFLLVSLALVVVGGAAVAWVLGQLIETSAINRTTSVTALYVESFVAPELQSLANTSSLTQPEIDSLQNLLSPNSPVGNQIVAFRIWSTNGTILYSPNPQLTGRNFGMEGNRGRAAQGAVTGDISNLTDPENLYERQKWSHLLEIYMPVRASRSSLIIAVAEFYQDPHDLEDEVNHDRLVAWGLVAAAALLAYLALARVVNQGSKKIISQDSELRERVRQLSALLEQNAGLHVRLRRSAERTTELNELERRRIGSDLHDGPTQTLAFAMLRLDAVEGQLEEAGQGGEKDLVSVRGALADALGEMRTIAAGLRTPELERATPAEIVRRAVADLDRRAGANATVDIEGIPDWAPLATKIALYRILSEALSNAARHGGGAGVEVRVTGSGDGNLMVEVRDKGPGFDSRQRSLQGHLGLTGMRERAELLGGRLEVESSVGGGTQVRAFLPLTEAASDQDD
ncbi:MAG: sensor histidine kinase [Candidatus Limnocylindrales bacterium]